MIKVVWDKLFIIGIVVGAIITIIVTISYSLFAELRRKEKDIEWRTPNEVFDQTLGACNGSIVQGRDLIKYPILKIIEKYYSEIAYNALIRASGDHDIGDVVDREINNNIRTIRPDQEPVEEPKGILITEIYNFKEDSRLFNKNSGLCGFKYYIDSYLFGNALVRNKNNSIIIEFYSDIMNSNEDPIMPVTWIAIYMTNNNAILYDRWREEFKEIAY